MPASILIRHRGTLARPGTRDPAAGDLLPQNDWPPCRRGRSNGGCSCPRVDANGVCDCNGCLMGLGDALLVLLGPPSFSERFGAGARPVHPIFRRGHSYWRSRFVEVKRTRSRHRGNDMIADSDICPQYTWEFMLGSVCRHWGQRNETARIYRSHRRRGGLARLRRGRSNTNECGGSAF